MTEVSKRVDRNLEAHLAVAALGGIIIGFALGWCWVNGWRAALNIRLVELLTAVGTVGAVIVALGLHRDNLARTKQGELRRAKVYAVEMRVPLQYFRNLAQSLSDLVLRWSQGKLGVGESELLLDVARQVCGFEQVKAMDFSRLDCLSPTIAGHLATGVTQLAQGAIAVQTMSRFLASASPPVDPVRSRILQTHVILRGGLDVFEGGYDELSKQAFDAILTGPK